MRGLFPHGVEAIRFCLRFDKRGSIERRYQVTRGKFPRFYANREELAGNDKFEKVNRRARMQSVN